LTAFSCVFVAITGRDLHSRRHGDQGVDFRLEGMTTAVGRDSVSLEDKYVASSGQALVSGIQALVRMTLEQRRLDRERGLRTAAYISGYEGSPLGGFDRELGRAHRHLEAEGIVFRPGVNEELAATAVAGTQLIGELDRRRHDGVTGFWYGKNPGLDRAADAIRHGNVSGTSPLGGVVALIGDDPESKSSTIPSSCESMCRSLLVPLLAPGTVDELLHLGLHAVALSRAAGLWAGIKIVADIADASATVSLADLAAGIPTPPDRVHRPPRLLPPTSVEAELDQMGARLDRALAYARDAKLNEISFEPERPRTAIVASGLAYQTVLRALDDLAIDRAAMEVLGIRLAKLSMPWPLDPDFAAAIADGVEEVVVVEDKLPFLEELLKQALYGHRHTPSVFGKHDREGRPLVPLAGAVGADSVAEALIRVLPDADLPSGVVERFEARAERGTALTELPTIAARTPFFCSGCPHNRSTRAADEQLVGPGIGCHIMVELDQGGRGELIGSPQMGGEGAQWLGLEPFTDDRHFVQNIGDGTFHHSGSLAIRAAVAANSNVTYKLLYNDAVAMTGGQRPEGKIEVPQITTLLAAEGVREVVVVTPEPASYRGTRLDPIARVRHRDDLGQVEGELSEVDGVTVLIYDDRCATEERRLRKRGELPTPAERIWINERVCEGCGDCGEKSTCLSVQPVETEFGRKTRIHQASCNQDFSCLDGDCPSFLVVKPGKRERRLPPEPPRDLPEPTSLVGSEVLLRMPGVGGTGVVTASQILQMAAHLDGLQAAGLEQTGLAQKGGPVISDVRISRRSIGGSIRAADAAADVLIGFDLLGAAAGSTLAVAEPGRTVAVISTSAVPTAEMVTDEAVTFPALDDARGRIDAVTRPAENVYLDAQGLSERLFGDHLPSNLLLLGAAYQRGCLPVSASAIERAIELNGAAVESNTAAFRWGRAALARPELLERVPRTEPTATVEPRGQEIVTALDLEPPLADLVAHRVSDLIGYQGEGTAAGYAEDVGRFAADVSARVGSAGDAVVSAYARHLHKLTAYKDEYEVARLHLDAIEQARLVREFGDDVSVEVLLHPPLLRAMGLKRKVRLGRSARPLFRTLGSAKRLRGTPFDPFGRSALRKLERRLAGEYRQLVADGLGELRADNVDLFRRLVELPDVIRGYEEIKVANVQEFRRRADSILGRLRGGEVDEVDDGAASLLQIHQAR
jgi:indolepyruvate ferredoxin oxidoreductase